MEKLPDDILPEISLCFWRKEILYWWVNDDNFQFRAKYSYKVAFWYWWTTKALDLKSQLFSMNGFIATRHETVEQNLISDFKSITKLWWNVGGGQAFKITALLLVRANTTKSILKTKATIVSWGDTLECWRHNSRQGNCIHKAGMLVFLQQNCSFKSISFSNGLISSFEAYSNYFSATSAVPGQGIFLFFLFIFFPGDELSLCGTICVLFCTNQACCCWIMLALMDQAISL